ncbi:MAG: hypothetical protein JO336_00955 [Acidobacteriia bacterium]|nr:hypothetical protein [Terriglobia bacterium]
MVQWWQQPFFQVALPIIITFILATWYQSSRVTDLRDALGKRIDDLRSDMNARFAGVDGRLDAIDRRLDRIESLMVDHSSRITKLEERTSPLRH